jgi:hypothetical protein
VSLSTDDPSLLTALAAGHVTVTAGTASADITVFAGPLPPGTVIWSNPGDGSGVQSIGKPGQPESLSERKYLMGDSPSSAGPAQKAFSCGEHRGDILRAANWPYPAVTGFQLGVSAIRCRKSFSKL